MAHKKGAGSTDNGRDSISKRLGVKLFGGQTAKAGNIIVRQRGTRFHAGANVYMGRDHTLHAAIDGFVVFKKTKENRSYVSIMPSEETPVTPVAPRPKIRPAANANNDTAKPAPKAAAKPADKPVAKKVEAAPAAIVAAPVVEAPAPVFVEPVIENIAPAAVEEVVIEAAAPEIVVIEETIVAEAPAAVEEVEMEVIETKMAEEAPNAGDADWDAVSVDSETSTTEETASNTVVHTLSRKIYTPMGVIAVDDLKIVEGIGPKIEQLLKDGGINTWVELSEAPIERIQEILDAAGPRYQIHNPATWPAQAKLAAEGSWEALKEYQDALIGGRDVQG